MLPIFPRVLPKNEGKGRYIINGKTGTNKDKDENTTTTAETTESGVLDRTMHAVGNIASVAENAAENAAENVASVAESAAGNIANAAIVAEAADAVTDIVENVENAAMEVATSTVKSISNLSDIINAFSKLESTVKDKFKDELVHPEIKEDVEIRKSNDLCKEEEDFLKVRKEYIKESFAKYVGVDVKEIDVDDIPVIAFAGSGGGFRAMIANTAYIRATQDSGLYDCGTYFAGVSGCCLSLAQQYSSLHATKDNPIQDLLDDFKIRLTDHIANPFGFLKEISKTSQLETAIELSFGGLVEKEHANLKARVIDTFGSLLTAKLLLEKDLEPQRQDFKLSQQKRFFKDGKKMMPIYTAVESHKAETEKVGLKKHYDWYEFTPFEIGSEEHGAWIPTWSFGREFKSGKSVNRVPEQNISQLLGMFGSAPCAPFKEYLETFKQVATDGWAKEKLIELYSDFSVLVGDDMKDKIEETSIFLPADNHYHGFMVSKLRFELLDSGVSNDLPLYPLVHSSRKVDVIIAFDSSGTVNKHEDFVKKQEELASRKGIKIEERDLESKYCEIYNYLPNVESDGPSAAHPCTLCYIPYLPNDKVKKNFAPCVEYFMTKFTYNEEEIDLMIKLAKQNWLEAAEEKVKNIIIEAWKKKRDARVKN
uniref:Lysophospholipase n=1 Tax=Rhizophagus irregularis (strain DAOM 181602 / DAOM 197198 / MUCL 43194) TaxID=747089 RepID=U9THW9_RHIID